MSAGGQVYREALCQPHVIYIKAIYKNSRTSLTNNPATNLFLEELKYHYQKILDIKNTLDVKANNLLTVSGTVGTLLFAFGAFFLEKLSIHYSYLIHVTSLLIGGISFIVISIVLSSWAFHIRKYKYAMDHRGFFDGDKLNNSAVDEYKHSNQADFYDAMIDTYLGCIKQNSETNDNKVTKLRWSEYFFIAGIFTAPLIAAIILINRQ